MERGRCWGAGGPLETSRRIHPVASETPRFLHQRSGAASRPVQGAGARLLLGSPLGARAHPRVLMASETWEEQMGYRWAGSPPARAGPRGDHAPQAQGPHPPGAAPLPQSRLLSDGLYVPTPGAGSRSCLVSEE